MNEKCHCRCGCKILLVASDGFGGTGIKCWKCKIGNHWEDDNQLTISTKGNKKQ